MKNLPMMVKMILGFMLVALLILAVGAACFFGLGGVRANLDEISATRMPSIQGLLLMKSALLQDAENQRLLMIRGFEDEERVKFYEGIKSSAVLYGKGQAMYEPLAKKPDEAALYAECKTKLARLTELRQKFVSFAHKYDSTTDESLKIALLEMTKSEIMPATADLFTTLDRIIALNFQAADAAKTQASGSVTTVIRLTGAVALCGFLLALGLGVLVSRFVTKPLRLTAAYAQEVAGGNFAAELDVHQKDEIGLLAEAIQSMVADLKAQMEESEAASAKAREQAERAAEACVQANDQETKVTALMGTMRDLAAQAAKVSSRLASSSEQLEAQVREVASGSETQKERLRETAEAGEQMNAAVNGVAGSAAQAADLADRARDKAKDGLGVVRESLAAISRVNDLAGGLSRNMRNLGEQAKAIGNVMTVISDIADQTNLLALNAAIEAARAGEAGRGFAVVADEVRKLAEKTMSATHEVESGIRAIQDAVRANVGGMEEAARATGEATELAGRSGQVLEEIVGLSEENAAQVQDIAAAAREQSAASGQINAALDEIKSIAQSASAGMSQSGAAIHDLAASASELEGIISRLKGS